MSPPDASLTINISLLVFEWSACIYLPFRVISKHSSGSWAKNSFTFMTWSVAGVALTHPGLYRSSNEDSILFTGTVISGSLMTKPELFITDLFPAFYAVADGIGGNVAGDRASRMVLEYFAQRGGSLRDRDEIYMAISGAKSLLDSEVLKDPALAGMGTTIAGLFLSPEGSVCFNCGDSRVYHISMDKVECLTHDHSLVQELCDQGILRDEQVPNHPYKHIITSSISGDQSLREPLVFIREVKWVKTGRFLLCTDGVWEIISPRLLSDIVSIPDLFEAATSLQSHCIQAGAPDNISFIILAPFTG